MSESKCKEGVKSLHFYTQNKIKNNFFILIRINLDLNTC